MLLNRVDVCWAMFGRGTIQCRLVGGEQSAEKVKLVALYLSFLCLELHHILIDAHALARVSRCIRLINRSSLMMHRLWNQSLLPAKQLSLYTRRRVAVVKGDVIPMSASVKSFSVLKRPPPNYLGHVPLTSLERVGLAIGSAVASIVNLRRHGQLYKHGPDCANPLMKQQTW